MVDINKDLNPEDPDHIVTSIVRELRAAPPPVAIDGRENVIDILKTALDAAERGEVTAVAIARITPEGYATTSWGRGAAGSAIDLIGAVAILQHRLVHDRLGVE